MRTQLGEIALLSRADGFRKQGEKCQLKAEQEMDPLDGQLWLLMAKQWSQLARNGPASGAGGRNTTPLLPGPSRRHRRRKWFGTASMVSAALK
jgi:hypothetical protein